MSSRINQEIDSNDELKKVQLGPKTRTVPVSWDIVRLEDISEVKRGASPRPIGDSKYFGGDVGWVRISDISNTGKYLTKTEEYLSDEGVNESVRVYPGQVLLSISASVGKPVILDIDACIHDGLVSFRNLIESIDREYLYYALIDLKPRLLAKGQTGTQSNVNSTLVKRSKIPLPPLNEQRRIADILSTVDEQIQQTGDVIEATKELKRGLMQKVFDINTTAKSGESDLLNNAQKKSLGDLVEVISGVHVKSEHVTHDSSETPYLTGPADFDHRGFSVTKYTDKTSKFCEPGDTLVTVKGSGCGNSTFATQKAGISRQLKALRPNDSVDERYLYYYLQTKTDLLSILAQGTSIPGLSTSDLTTLTIPLPKLDVQQQIGNIFETIDNQTTIEREHKQTLQELKRGLMEDLLTGKVRVNTD